MRSAGRPADHRPSLPGPPGTQPRRVVRAGVPASRLHRMAPTPLAELAWQVHSLLAEDRTRARFLDQCLEYLRLRPEHPDRPPPLPFDTDDNIEPPDKPPLMLCERYA